MGKELLVCLPTAGFGGHERMVVRIAAALAQGGTHVTVICAPLQPLLDELSPHPDIEVCPVYGAGKRHLDAVYVTVRELLRCRGCPVLFAPGRMLVHRRHIIAAGLLGRQVLVYVPTCRDSGLFRERPRRWLADRAAASFVSRWLTITGPLASALRKHRHVRAPVDVIPNTAPDPGSLPPVHGCETDGRLRVLFLGRYDPHAKGLDWLVAALRQTKARWMGEIRFEFRGNGRGRTLLEGFAGECGPEHIVVNGWGDSYLALSGADLLILPSREEGFPLVFIEAAKAGVPVLSSGFEGAAELLGEGAWLKVGDAERLVEALHRLRDAPLRRQVADVQRATVLAHADEGRFAAAIAALQTRL